MPFRCFDCHYYSVTWRDITNHLNASDVCGLIVFIPMAHVQHYNEQVAAGNLAATFGRHRSHERAVAHVDLLAESEMHGTHGGVISNADLLVELGRCGTAEQEENFLAAAFGNLTTTDRGPTDGYKATHGKVKPQDRYDAYGRKR